MSKTTLRNVKPGVEVREPKGELSEAELKTVFGGSFVIMKHIDKASAKFYD